MLMQIAAAELVVDERATLHEAIAGTAVRAQDLPRIQDVKVEPGVQRLDRTSDQRTSERKVCARDLHDVRR